MFVVNFYGLITALIAGSIMIKEQGLVKSILEWLSWQKIFHFRFNTGAFSYERNGKKRFYRFGDPGASDIFCLIKGIVYGLECKAGKYSKQSDSQIDWQKRFEKAGGKYRVIRTLKEAIEFLDA